MKNEPPTHVLGLADPPIPVVRIGLIGLGNRGLLTLERYMLIEHVEIKALCEIRPGNLAKGQALLTKDGHPAATGYAGENGWQQMCCNPDIDLIIICTDWLTHTPMATYAMEQGKHVAIEVPAAMTHASVAGTTLQVPANLVRISVGIENADDLIADLKQALDRI